MRTFATLFLCLILAGPLWAGDTAQDLPDEVFTGLDFEPLDGFERLSLSSQDATQMDGTFTLEAGGAQQTLAISQLNTVAWEVTRTLTEPGEPPFTRSYIARLADGVLQSEDGLTVLATPGGLLVLETQDDIIDPSAYTFYAGP